MAIREITEIMDSIPEIKQVLSVLRKKDKETNTPTQVYYFEPEPKSSGIGKYIAAAAVGALIALVG
ncbi:MAG: hypothetical protein J6R96_01715 [Spirochaetaceae bacterium]|nr:hypothetical protein [Spirochaetaceae bacterium]